MFNQELFEQNLSTTWLGRNFYYFEELASTNSYVKKLESSSALHGSIILADHQSSGRGQHERKWESTRGENLTFSLIFSPETNERFTLLTLACALAVSESINEETGITAKIKWPNDIIYKQKKLGGILTETQFSGNKLEKVIIGIGLNVNQQKFESELNQTASSLTIINKEKYCRENILGEILLKIEYYYRLWIEHNPMLLKQINHALKGYGEWVKLKVNKKILEGRFKFLGVNNSGAMIALNRNLDVKTFAYEQVRIIQNAE